MPRPMSPPSNSASSGRVQWVAPPGKVNLNRKKVSTSQQNRFRYGNQSEHSLQVADADDPLGATRTSVVGSQTSGSNLATNRETITFSNSSNHVASQQRQASMDDAICRTLCTIIEQYLKELREHQRHINEARSRLIREMPHEPEGNNFITYNDISRLRVRDEQTKAIETIKQLTNYLRELSSLKAQTDTATDLVGEEINGKLSDVRNDIIQALNDFVIANNDIEIPILDPDDSSISEFDMCAEVHRSPSDYRKLEVSQESSDSREKNPLSNKTHQFNRSIAMSESGTKPVLLVRIDDTSVASEQQLLIKSAPVGLQEQQQQQLESQENKFIEANKRKREVHKLVKDTMELRRLFADFYDLVKVQGEQVDSIEDNIMVAAQHLSEGRYHLDRSMKGMTILVPMTGCITGALIGGPIGLIVGGKLGSVTFICVSSLLGLLSGFGARKCLSPAKHKKS